MKKVLVFKLKNGIIIECEEGLIEVEEDIFRSKESGSCVKRTKRYYVRSRKFCMEFLQEEIESVNYKLEDNEANKDRLAIAKDIYENKNYSLAELSINFLKELCELELKEIRKEKEGR